MDKWEHCAVGPIKADTSGPEAWSGNRPALISFGREGITFESVAVPGCMGSRSNGERNSLAGMIATLGDEGWQMVGCGSCLRGKGHRLYFKRPE